MAIDLDGVLLDGMKFHIEAWHAAFEKYDYFDLDDQLLYRLEGIKTQDVIDRICAMRQVDLSPEDRFSIAAKKKETYASIFLPEPLDGAGTFLETLRRFGYRMAIVTGTSAASATATLEVLGMREHIDFVISSDLHIPGKPDPAPFREAARRFGVAPGHCLGVDNAPAGVTSAVTAGLPCVAVATYLPAVELSEAGTVLDTVHELATWIQTEHERSGGTGTWLLTS